MTPLGTMSTLVSASVVDTNPDLDPYNWLVAETCSQVMGACKVPGCNVTGKTSHYSIKYCKVHPNARGKLFKVTAERRKVWVDLLNLDDESEDLSVCARHFSLLQYNEVRLSRAYRYNILVDSAYPDLAIPGRTDDPTLPVYEEMLREP